MAKWRWGGGKEERGGDGEAGGGEGFRQGGGKGWLFDVVLMTPGLSKDVRFHVCSPVQCRVAQLVSLYRNN